MQHTQAYRDGYIHSTYPDERYPLHMRGEPRYTAQIHGQIIECRTYIGAKRAITRVMRVMRVMRGNA